MKKINSTRFIKYLILLFLFLINNSLYSQSSSFGNTYIFNNGEMAIVDIQHNFFNGGSGIQPGIVGSDRTTSQGFLSFVGTASWTGASNSAFVDGYVKTYMTSPFVFPIGDNNKYRPAAVSTASIANPANAAYYGISAITAITSRLRGGDEPVLPAGGPFNTALMGAGVGSVDNVEYWDINGATSAKITLTWDATSAVNSLTSLSILGWNGTQWVAIASSVDSTSLLGSSSVLASGSITTNAVIVPDTYAVYTLGTICNAGSIAPVLSSNAIGNICPTTTVNLNSLVTSSTPSGASLVWFINNTHTGITYSTPTAAVAGTYYPFYFDSVNSCYSPAGSMVTVTITASPDIPTVASIAQPTCVVSTGSIIFSVQTGVEYSVDNGSNYQSSSTFSGLSAGTYTLNVRNNINTTCVTSAISPVTLYSLSLTPPNLTISGAICNGNTYNVSFNSDGVVSATAGTIIGNSVTGISIGTNVVLTSTSINGCASSQSSVVSPPSCINPPIGCETPILSAGSGICSGSGAYSVSVNTSNGAVISSNFGIVSGNSITGIPLGTSVTITASSGTCSNSVIVVSPIDCTSPCSATRVSYSIGACLGATYNVSISNPNSINITATAGIVTTSSITGIPIGTDVTITATASGCTPEIVTLNSPSRCLPNFTPTIDIDNVVFLTEGVSRDFVVNISEIGNSPSHGQIVFMIPKQSAFSVTYSSSTILSSGGGGTVVNNCDWTISENSLFITVTSNPSLVISSNSFSSIGFEVSRKPNIPNQTWQPITVTIINNSGSDSLEDDNTYNLIIKTQ